MVFVLFCCKICSVGIHADLSRHLFCCNFRTFFVEKINPKVLFVEKKWEIWCMTKRAFFWTPYLSSSITCSNSIIKAKFGVILWQTLSGQIYFQMSTGHWFSEEKVDACIRKSKWPGHWHMDRHLCLLCLRRSCGGGHHKLFNGHSRIYPFWSFF